MSDLLSLNFTASNTVRGAKRPYTIYEIEVRSSSTMPWLLYKRYRDFDALDQHLKKLVQNKPELKNIQLPSLTPKRLKSLAPEVVSKRQIELQEYSQKLLEISQLLRDPILLDFLSVPESLRAMLTRTRSGQSKTEGPGVSTGPRPSRSTGDAIPNEAREVMSLLKELSLQKNRVKALSKFEQWYFDTRPRISQEYIRMLFVGDDNYQGLVHACGFLGHSKVAWRASISLLVKLLDIERNKDAKLFQEIFLGLEKGFFKEMNLQRHIKDPTTQEDGFRIVLLIRSNLPRLDWKHYVADLDAWKSFEKWQKIQNDSLKFISKEPEEREKERAYNYKESKYSIICDLIHKQFEQFSTNDEEKDYQYLENIKSKYNLNVRYKKLDNSDEWKMKITFNVNHLPEEVYRLLKKGYIKINDKKEYWNTKILNFKTTELDSNHHIIYEVYKSFNSPYKFRDFVLLRSCRTPSSLSSSAPDSPSSSSSSSSSSFGYTIVYSSISHYDEFPETKERLRTVVLPSGFEIKPLKDDPTKSRVSFRTHMTSESVLLVSADLLGETDELFQSMLKIGELLTISKLQRANVKK